MSKSLKIVVSTLIVASIAGSFVQIAPDSANAAEVTKVNSEALGESSNSLLNINTSLEGVSKSSNSAEDYELTENSKDGVILHAWCWSFNTIKENMKDIAEAGYSTVQTSPANNCVVGDGGGMDIMGNGKWYYHYQPTDWKIGNYQLGSRDDFKAMCAEAKKYGVKIIVDVVPNHTTTDLGAVSQDFRNAFTSGKMYHNNGFTSISNYNDRYQCTLEASGGLPDVNTEDPGFQKYFLNYLNDLIDCGASGFRYDTAKHIGLPDDPQDGDLPNNFWPVVTGEQSVDGVSLKNKDKLFIYGEILQDSNVRETDYAKYISMTASDYGWHIDGAIKDCNFEAGRVKDWSHKCSPDKLVTWVESHDTYCNEGKTKDLTDWQIKMAWAVLAAREGGTPLFYDRPAGSGNGNWWGNNRIGAKGSDLFKDPEVVAVNKFRTAMVGEEENLTNPENDNKILMIERGDKGATIINLGDAKDIECDTNLKDGTYEDKVSGNEFTVSDGKLTAHLEAKKVACIYNGKASTAPKVSASSKESNFKTDTLDVTLNCKNVTEAKYSIDGGEKKSFNDGDIIKIGKDAEFNTPIKLVVEGTGEDGKTVTEEYKYIKKDPDAFEGNRAYLKLPDGWKDAYIYLYDSGDGNKKNADWPGVQMTKVEGEDNLYYYDIPDGYTKPLIIFNEGGGDDCKKYPEGDKAPGKEISGQMIYDGTEYKEYVKQNKHEEDKKISISKFEASDNILAGEEAKIYAAAEGGNGKLSYKVTVTDSDDNEVLSEDGDFSDGEKEFSFKPETEGKYKAVISVIDEKKNTQEKEISFNVNKKKEEIKPIKINSIGVNDGDEIKLGESFNIDVDAEGGNGDLSYIIQIEDSDGNIVKKSNKSTLSWTPEEKGDYNVLVTVTDSMNGKQNYEASLSVNEEKIIDKDKPLEITDFTATDLGNGKIELNAQSKDGTGEISYTFYNVTSSGDVLINNSKDNIASALWTAEENGTYEFKVVCTDDKGTKKEKTLTKKIDTIIQDENKIPDSDNSEVKGSQEDNNQNNKTGDNRGLMALVLSAAASIGFIKSSKRKSK